MTDVDYRFKVKREELKRADGTDTEYDAIYRASDGKQLSVVSRGYQLITHDKAMDFVFGELDKAGLVWEEKRCELTNEGKRLLHEITFPGYEFDIPGDNSGSVPSLKTRNSIDRSRSFTLDFGTWRLVCSNGASVGTKLWYVSQIHYMDQIKFDEIGPQIGPRIEETISFVKTNAARLLNESAKKYMKDLLRTMPALFLSMTAGELAEWFTFEMKMKGGIEVPTKAKVKKAMDAYQLFQVLTAVATHRIRSAGKRQKVDAQISRLMLKETV